MTTMTNAIGGKCGCTTCAPGKAKVKKAKVKGKK